MRGCACLWQVFTIPLDDELFQPAPAGRGEEVAKLLVLTRKEDQSIMIGDDIEVIVSSIDGNTVRIGIKAPRDLKILRKETFEEVRQENLRAVQAAARYTGEIDRMLPRTPGAQPDSKDDA